MAIVMDMCSGGFEMELTSKATDGELVPLKPTLNMCGTEQLALTQVTGILDAPFLIPVSLVAMDVEIFLRRMDKHS